MVVRARKETEKGALNKVVYSYRVVGNEKSPPKVNKGPEDEGQADAVKAFFEKDFDRLVKF
jgi:hypothetical protein